MAEPEEKARANRECSRAAMTFSKFSLRARVSVCAMHVSYSRLTCSGSSSGYIRKRLRAVRLPSGRKW